EPFEVIGIDEISLKKGHKDFVAIVTARQGNETRILGVLEDRMKETVIKFFRSIPKVLDLVGYKLYA
ncbi:MAG: transposase, partial [Lamprocystis purpurea]|nr:transposase [Lamprocystis purpurea]